MAARADDHIRAKCFHPKGTFVEFPKEDVEISIPDRFETIVKLYPHRTAFKTRTQRLSYEELNRFANRIGWALISHVRNNNEPVALLLKSNAALAAAILGVLKAASIYVPLDPSHPRERLRFLVGDTQSKLILTDSYNMSLGKELAGTGAELLNIEEIDSSYSPENPRLNIPPERLAYIRYTSGSTGEPKGIMENHRNLLHVVMRQTNGYHICADDRMIFLGSWGKHIFRSLLNGAAFYPSNIKNDGLSQLSEWLVEEAITVCCSIPSVFRHFVETLTGHENFPDLRMIRLAGESATLQDVDLFKKFFSPDCILVHELGCTEAGTLAHYMIDKQTQIRTNTLPVGYAEEDVQILLINDGKRVGYNEVGEITVKSRYLTPGYWRRPDLTQAAFSPDPDGTDEHLYRTGDLGLMLPDGCLLHLGRKDFQVKIRGQRIEVAEVEKILNSHSAIRASVVVAREHEGETRLVAYFVWQNGNNLKTRDLRNFLRGALPDHMVPAVFIPLDALPLTSNGKVDRKALPDPGRSRPDLAEPYVAPRTTTEKILVRIWAEVLSLCELGVHDSFLDLGGHSLAAARVVSGVVNEFQIDIPLQSLLQSPTISDMAAMITEHQKRKLQKTATILDELESLSDEDAMRLVNAPENQEKSRE